MTVPKLLRGRGAIEALTEIMANVLTGRVALQYDETGQRAISTAGVGLYRRRWIMTDLATEMPELDREQTIGLLDTLATAVMLACDQVRAGKSLAQAIDEHVPDTCIVCGKPGASERLEVVHEFIAWARRASPDSPAWTGTWRGQVERAAIALGMEPARASGRGERTALEQIASRAIGYVDGI